MICYAIHQLNTSSRAQDDIHHQFQLVLRNTESAGSLISQLLKIGWIHKGFRLEAYRRSLVFFIVAVIHGLAFWAAATMSSGFLTQTNEVMLLSDVRTCGWMEEPSDIMNLSDEKVFEKANALVVMMRYNFKRSAAYSRSCYMQTGGNSTSCRTYVQPALQSTISTDVACPFDEKICNGKAITIDSGYIRSDQHLGINTRLEDSILARKVLTCVPLAAEKYTDGWIPVAADLNLTMLPEGALLKGYKFGPAKGVGVPFEPYTFWLDNFTIPFSSLPYELSWYSSFVHHPATQVLTFDPIPELVSPTADLTVIALINRNLYRTPIEDPWFNSKNITNTRVFGEAYSATNAGSFLGCQERYEFCTHDKTTCSPFSGLPNINVSDPESSLTPDLNPTQEAVSKLVWRSMWSTQLFFQLGFIGRDYLVANEYLWDSGFRFGMSAALPSDHWHREVANWMNTTLSALQRWPMTIARPPEFDIGPGISSRDHIIPMAAGPMQELCRKMKAKSSAHMSFSVLGIFITLSVGLFLIIGYTAVPKLVARLQKRTGVGQHKRLEWTETSAFQLQRMAAEGRGVGPWTGRDDDVPKLENHGHRFNLTEKSLKGVYSRVESYSIAQKGLSSPELDDGYEMGGMEYNRETRPMGTRTITNESQIGLLGEEQYSRENL